jgi:hypothetical protein
MGPQDFCAIEIWPTESPSTWHTTAKTLAITTARAMALPGPFSGDVLLFSVILLFVG